MDEIIISGAIFRYLTADGDESELESTSSQKIGVFNPEVANKMP